MWGYIRDALGNLIPHRFEERGGGSGGSTGCCKPKIQVVAVTQPGQLAAPKPGYDIIFYEVNLAAPGNIIAPVLTGVEFKMQLFIIITGGTIGVQPPVGATINGHAAGSNWVTLDAEMGVLLRKVTTAKYAGIQGLGA